MRRVITGLATLGVFLAAALPTHAGQPNSRLSHLTLQLKWLPHAQFAGYFVAQDLGFYRQQGLDVTLKPGGPTITPENVVRDGHADIGVDWLSGLLVARDHGANLTNIAQIFQTSGMQLIASKRAGIRSVSGFRGKRVGIWFGGNQYPFYALVKRYHMWPPRQYMKVVPQDFSMKQFLTHDIDVASVTTYNELGSVYEHGLKPKDLTVFNYRQLGVTVLEDGLFARPDWLRTHASLATRFIRASVRGWRWALSHPYRAGMISYRHEKPGYSSARHQVYMARAVAKLVAAGLSPRHTIGYMSADRYAATWRALLSEHVIRRPPNGAYDQRYWKEAGGH